jgi:hypothetical protein
MENIYIQVFKCCCIFKHIYIYIYVHACLVFSSVSRSDKAVVFEEKKVRILEERDLISIQVLNNNEYHTILYAKSILKSYSVVEL